MGRYRLNRMGRPVVFMGRSSPLLGQLLALALPAHVISQLTIANEVNAKLFSMIANGLVSVRDVIRMAGSVGICDGFQFFAINGRVKQ